MKFVRCLAVGAAVAIFVWLLGVWLEADFYSPLLRDSKDASGAILTRLFMLYGFFGGAITWWNAREKGGAA